MSQASQPRFPQAYALDRENAPAFWALGILWLPLATGVQTNNRLTLLQQEFVAGPGPAAHYHHYDEGFYILEGEFTFQAGGDTYHAGAGALLHIPRLTQHSFVVNSPTAKVLNFYPSSGFELLIMGLGQAAPARRVPTPAETPLPVPEQVEILLKLGGHTDVYPPFGFGGAPNPDHYVTHPVPWTPSALRLTTAQQSPTYAALGSHWTLLASSADTAGSYAVFSQELPPHTAPTPQRHAEDEAVYVLTGTLRVVLDEQTLEAPAGTFVFIPAGTVHALTAVGEAARFLNFYLPGGFERGVVDFGTLLAASGQPAGAKPAGDIQVFFDQTGTHTVAAG